MNYNKSYWLKFRQNLKKLESEETNADELSVNTDKDDLKKYGENDIHFVKTTNRCKKATMTKKTQLTRSK